jgi:hypothetical protein
MSSKEQYATPELTLVGETSDVVFGLGGVGADYLGELEIPDFEFLAD